MKNKKIVIIISVIVGIIALSIGIGFLAIRHLEKTAIKKQQEIIEARDDANKINFDDIIDVGDFAPDFTLQDLDGNTISLDDFKGEKVVFLNFWATWCPPCRAEMPDLDKVYQESKGEDFIVLAINLGESEKIVKEFMAENGYSFPVLLDKTQKVGFAYNTFSIPTSVLVDKEGKVRVYRPGAMTYNQMIEMVESIQ
ncbi:Thiol-disulfide oxidoreductase resA [Proteiniborus sp. DW1]|uniref:TlpA family protein disulfide reductase n=1 Tax=Proteiniborus sp. DW1 TaxID=1889883 RepID=UPI00092DEBDD|nr:TlpA disulfide reductase family protein [Proteiniborus sp. DW1]SCG81758.1 Thiol-disulfide oxidoreductase resA [Proteiniborus sp. DW1]